MRSSFDPGSVEAYSNSHAGIRRGLIAEDESNPYTYEDVDRWPQDRVDYYWTRRTATGKYRDALAEAEREEWEDEYDIDSLQNGGTGSGPSTIPVEMRDELSQEQWDLLPAKIKQDAASGGTVAVSKRELRRYTEAVEDGFFE